MNSPCIRLFVFCNNALSLLHHQSWKKIVDFRSLSRYLTYQCCYPPPKSRPRQRARHRKLANSVVLPTALCITLVLVFIIKNTSIVLWGIFSGVLYYGVIITPWYSAPLSHAVVNISFPGRLIHKASSESFRGAKLKPPRPPREAKDFQKMYSTGCHSIRA